MYFSLSLLWVRCPKTKKKFNLCCFWIENYPYQHLIDYQGPFYFVFSVSAFFHRHWRQLSPYYYKRFDLPSVLLTSLKRKSGVQKQFQCYRYSYCDYQFILTANSHLNTITFISKILGIRGILQIPRLFKEGTLFQNKALIPGWLYKTPVN